MRDITFWSRLKSVTSKKVTFGTFFSERFLVKKKSRPLKNVLLVTPGASTNGHPPIFLSGRLRALVGGAPRKQKKVTRQANECMIVVHMHGTAQEALMELFF